MVYDSGYDWVQMWVAWLAATAVAIPLAKVSIRNKWLAPNWRHELSNNVIGWVVVGILAIMVVYFVKVISHISLIHSVVIGSIIGALIGGLLWLVNKPEPAPPFVPTPSPATAAPPLSEKSVTVIPKSFDQQLKDALLDKTDDVASAQAARLKESGDEKIAQARALRLDAELRPAMNHLLDVITETIQKAADERLITIGKFEFGLPERAILSLRQAQPSQSNPNMTPIVKKVSMGENVEWRIRLDYGYIMTPSQSKERGVEYDFVGPFFYIIEMRRLGQFQMGNFSLDELGHPEAHINNVLPTTRSRLMPYYEKLSGDDLIRFFVLELIKETQTRTELMAQP